MKRRKTVSVTPAMGASTVAGRMVTLPIKRLAGTGLRAGTRGSDGATRSRAGVPAPHVALTEVSQNFFTWSILQVSLSGRTDQPYANYD